MKIYFLSSTPCALTLNGVFYGVTDTFERSAELSLADNIYAQFSPQGKQPIGFFIDETLPTTPPDGCEVYILRDGIAVYACDFPPSDFTLRPIVQKREGELLATVYVQGHVQLSVQSPQGFFNATLPPAFDPCEMDFHCGRILLKGERLLGVYSQTGERLLVEEVLDFTKTEEGVAATLPLCDSLRRVADCRWDLTKDDCPLTEFTLRQPNLEGAPREDLLAYAFLESVLIKANYRALLSDELQGDCEQILTFLGDFIGVTLTKNPATCGLIRKKGERLFVLDYVTVEVENGKIVDIRG